MEPPDDIQTTVVKLLNVSGIHVESFSAINGLRIPREALVRPDKYTEVAHLIPQFKAFLSSTHLTSLQGEAPGAQRWPLLNLVRQVLKATGFVMIPRRLSDGYSADGRKRYSRVFDISLPKPVET